MSHEGWFKIKRKVELGGVPDSDPTHEVPLLLFRENKVRHQWSLLSYELFVRSEGKFFRAREKCREQWFNHLAPDIRKGEWNSEEDVLLFSSVISFGRKWSKISKTFEKTRTEHLVKNRYNAILSKMKKKFKKVKDIDEKIFD